MAEDPIEPLEDDVFLPYDTEYLNAACYALEILSGIDGKLYSQKEGDRIETSKRRLRQIIHASVKNLHKDYFQKDDEEED